MKVFVPNNSGHDFSDAQRFGALVFMSEGEMNRFGVNNMHRKFSAAMADSEPEDYILQTGLGVMNMVAAAVFAAMHGRLNLLLYKDGRYIERRLVLR